jgi:protein-disulfide isomerase
MAADTAADAGRPSERGRLWLIIGLVISIIGIAASIYSVRHHLEVKATGQTDAVCNINATFNCDEVALSKYSEPFGIPLGVFGLGYFVANAILIGLGLRGGSTGREHTHAYVVMVLIGLVTSLALGGLSAVALGTFCLTCIAIYTLTIVQAGTLFAFRKEIPDGFNLKSTFNGGSTAAIAVAIVVILFSTLKPSPKPGSTEESAAIKDPEAPQLATKAEDIAITRSPYGGLGEDYRKGPDNASVVIVEFADFQCPACKNISGTLEQIHKEFPDRVQVVYRMYPLDQSCNSSMRGPLHQHACTAAVMARCAGQYGKFWEMHDLLYGNQSDIKDAKIKEWGKQLGLTDEQMSACLASNDLMAKIKDDIAVGTALGIDSTPTVYINGRKLLGGRGVEDIRQQVEQLLN